MDCSQLAREWIRQIRGRRSQVAFSKRLGYRTNVLYAWESGRDFPTAARFFAVMARTGVDVQASLLRFHRGSAPLPLAALRLDTAAGVAGWLSALRGKQTVLALAERTGYSRYAIARWMSGRTEPRLPQLLQVIEVCSLRLLDFVAAFADPSELASIADAHADLVATRKAAHDAPWTQAVLRCLELSEYESLAAHAPGFIAARIGISEQEEAACLELLERSGQIRLEHGRYRPARVLVVDTRRDPRSTQALRAFWTRTAMSRLEAGGESVFSYNVFGVSEADYQKLRELHAEYFRRAQEIISESQPVERVVVASAQLVPLDGKRGMSTPR